MTIPPFSLKHNHPQPSAMTAGQPVFGQTRVKYRQPQFSALLPQAMTAGGAMGLFSWAVDKLSKRSVELAVTDFSGMTVPRAKIEWDLRGADTARETAIREVAGMLFNVFVSGWVSILMVRAFGDRVNPMNPLGMNHRAMVDAKMAELLGGIYQDVLQRADITTPKEANRAFVKAVLGRLQSTDHQLAQTQIRYAQNGHHTLSTPLTEGGALLTEKLEALASQFEADSLVEEARQTVLKMSPNSELPAEALSDGIRRQRLNLSKQYVSGEGEKAFVQAADQIGRLGQLSQQVDFLDADGRTILIGNRSRSNIFKQLRAFLHEIVDPALHTPTGEALDGDQWKTQAIRALFKENKGGILAKFIPSAEDGLLRYLNKSKYLVTGLPVILTVLASISVAFINNHITKKRHGGKTYFPGEGTPPHTPHDRAGHSLNSIPSPLLQYGQTSDGNPKITGVNSLGPSEIQSSKVATHTNSTKLLQPALSFGAAIPGRQVVPKPGWFMKLFDFQDFGQSVLNQVKLIYGLIIASRLVAAGTRSYNELRETALRDTLGYAFWLFTVPMLQNLSLFAMDSQYEKGLLRKRETPTETGFRGQLKRLNHRFNPVAHWQAPSTQQIRDRAEYTLDQLVQNGHGKESELYQNLESRFNKLVYQRNAVTGLGVLLTIGLLGFIIPKLNIVMTQKQVAEGNVGKKRSKNKSPQNVQQPFLTLPPGRPGIIGINPLVYPRAMPPTPIA